MQLIELNQIKIEHQNKLNPNSKFLFMSAITEKGESQNGCYNKIKQAEFFEKQTFLTPMIRTFGVICFLVTPIKKFALLPSYRCINLSFSLYRLGSYIFIHLSFSIKALINTVEYYNSHNIIQ